MTQMDANVKTGTDDAERLSKHSECKGEVLIPQSRDQSEDWRIAGALKF